MAIELPINNADLSQVVGGPGADVINILFKVIMLSTTKGNVTYTTVAKQIKSFALFHWSQISAYYVPQ